MFLRPVAIALFGLFACSSANKPNGEGRERPLPPSADDAFFAPEHVLAVSLTMPDKDWSSLRTKGRDASSLATECRQPAAKIYPTYSAKVSLDGVALENIDVRKKGFLGSLSVLRPSLKLRLDPNKTGQRYRGVKRLTLNNNKQDAALMRTCLAYKVFRDARVPAPRCNFARVTVNGAELGIFSNVEPIKKPFLRRHFGDDKGTLFEGQIADFAPSFLGNFEQKTNKSSTLDRQALEKLAQALSTPESGVVAAVSPYVDIDEFLTFWAIETLIGHWDGYSSNRNNFYLYRSPSDGKFHFIPWGPDLSFTNADPFHSPTRPATVSATAALASRLYALPQVRASYATRLRELLESVWDEKALLAEVDRIDTLLSGSPDDKGVQEIKAFIAGRKQHMSSELAAGGGEWKEKTSGDPCFTAGASISGTFETTFESISAANPMVVGKASLSLVIGGKSIALTSLGVVAGRDEQSGNHPVVRFVGISGSSIFGVQLFFEEPLFRSGETQPFQGFATWGMVFELEEMRTFKVRGFLGSGRITLEQAGTSKDNAVNGSFDGTLFESPADSH